MNAIATIAPPAAWYAVRIAPGGLTFRHTRLERTHPRLEGKARLRGSGPLGFPAEEILLRYGYAPFIPTESIFIRHNAFHSGMKKRVRRALIPSMVFLNLSAGVNWFHLLNVPMVTGVFGINGVPRRFRENEIARLEAMSESLRQPDYYRPMPTRRGYKVGDLVIDLGGRLPDFPMEVVEIKGETAKLLANLFGGYVEVEARTANLAKWG